MHFILTLDRLPLPDSEADRLFDSRSDASHAALEVASRIGWPVTVTRVERGRFTDVERVTPLVIGLPSEEERRDG